METRANYILIGAFTLAGLLGMFGFTLWLSKLGLERQFAYYEVLFTDVSGLNTAGSVRYNGLPVGQVVGLALDPDDPSKVRVRIEVDASTPIKTDTIAQLEAQGVTGVSFVGLSGGSATADPLPQGGVIQSRPSALQSLFQGAPELLTSANELLQSINQVFDDTNRTAVADMLTNLSSASDRLNTVLGDFEGLSTQIGSAVEEVAGFTDQLQPLTQAAETALNTATETLNNANTAVDSAVGTLDTARTTFSTADNLMRGELADFIRRGSEAAASLDGVVQALEPSAVATLDAARAFADTTLPTLVTDLNDVLARVETQVTSVGDRASAVLDTYRDVGTAVEARVNQTASAIAAFQTATEEATETLEAVRQASDAASVFLRDEGQPLAAEARATLEAARGLTDTQLPGLIEQANTALSTVNREAIALSGEAQTTLQSVTGAVDQANETLTAARSLANDRIPGLIDQANATLATVDREAEALSGDISTLIQTATARLDDARTIFDQINTAVGQAGDVMSSFQGTSGDIAALVREQGEAFLADARAAAAQARDAIGTISATIEADLPVLVQELQTAAATANRVIASVGSDVGSVATEFGSLSQASQTALATAIDTFERSNQTLEWINGAMDSAEGTLRSAEQAFNSVNRLLDEDVDGIVDDVRVAAGTFTAMIETVSQDVTRATGQVQQASASASNLIATLETIVVANQRQVSDFLRVGLPSVQQFVDEARRLTSSLDRLVTRLERDPARFLLGTNSSEFRR